MPQTNRKVDAGVEHEREARVLSGASSATGDSAIDRPYRADDGRDDGDLLAVADVDRARKETGARRRDVGADDADDDLRRPQLNASTADDTHVKTRDSDGALGVGGRLAARAPAVRTTTTTTPAATHRASLSFCATTSGYALANNAAHSRRRIKTPPTTTTMLRSQWPAPLGDNASRSGAN